MIGSWQQHATCTATHATYLTRIGLQLGDHPVRLIVVTANKRIQVAIACGHCGAKTTGALPHALWPTLLTLPTRVQVNQPYSYEPCTVCGCPRPGVEYHHFAPRNTFTDTADLWPVLPLCLEHHREWHQRMDGYRWQARTGWADAS